MFHLSERTLESLVSATATASDVNRILRHVSECRACARRLEEWRDSFAEVDQFFPELAVGESQAATVTPGGLVVVPSRDVHHRFRPDFANLLWVLAILLALLVGYGANRLRSAHEGLDALDLPRRLPSPQTVAGRSAAAFPQRSAAPDSAVAASPVPSGDNAEPAGGAPAESVAVPPRSSRAAADSVRPRPARPAPAPAVTRPAPRPAPVDAKAPVDEDVGPVPLLPLSPQFRAIRLIDAARRMGGPVRLLGGLVPDHVEIGPGTAVPGAIRHLVVVRVVYRSRDGGRILLDQQLIPADSSGFRPIDDPALETGQTAYGTAPSGVSVATWLDEEGYRLSLAAVAPADSLKQLIQLVR